MRKTFVTLAMILTCTATPVLAMQDPRIPQAEQDADKIEAQAMYDRQRQRDQAEADRVAKENASRITDYDLYIARQKAEQEARMAAWRAQVAKEKADYEASVAQCIAEKRCSPRQ